MAHEGEEFADDDAPQPLGPRHTHEHLVTRQPGALRGQIWTAEDFDALPDDVLAAEPAKP